MYKTINSHLTKLQRLLEAKLTFGAARSAVQDYLSKAGWKMSGPLKVPHATSPDGYVRLWFKPQAVWFSAGNAHSLHGARSVHSDIRSMSPEAFVQDAEKFARKAGLGEADVGQLYFRGVAERLKKTLKKARR